MESRIKIRATVPEMKKFFDEPRTLDEIPFDEIVLQPDEID